MADSFSNVYAGANVKTPTHDIKLRSVDGKQLGLILCDKRGRFDPRGIVVGSMPRTALKTAQGNTGYDNLELPYITEVQTTFSGGRGLDDFTKDRTRYADSYRMDTTREFPVCGPLETNQIGIGVEALNQDIESEYEARLELTSASDPIAFKIKIVNAGNIRNVSFNLNWEEIPYTPLTLKYSILALAQGASIPDLSTLEFTTLSLDERPIDSEYWQEIVLPCNLGVLKNQSLVLVLKDFSQDMEVRYSITGGWGGMTENGYIFAAENSTSSLAYLIVIDDEIEDEIDEYQTDTWVTIKPWGSIYGSLIYGSNSYIKVFEYKHQMYAVVNEQTDTGAPKLFINGYRGAAKSNASNLSYTITGLPMTTDELVDKIILIYNGPGEEETQPWRKIVSNNSSGNIKVEPQWNVQQSGMTEFVVLGTDTWTEITGHGLTAPITDIAVVEDYVVFAQGVKAPVRIMHEYDNGGTWTREFASHKANQWKEQTGATETFDQQVYADLLENGVLLTGENVLWRARVDDSKVDYSFVKKWAEGGYENGEIDLFFFDVNKVERDGLRIELARTQEDLATEQAETDPDEGVITSYERMIQDLNHQIKHYLTDTFNGNPLSTDYRFLPYYIVCGSEASNITGMIMYGSPPIPYIFKEDSIGSIQNNIYAELPIAEMRFVRSENNGKAAMQHGVYLYFSMEGGMIERYYDQRMDDVGPTGDDALPSSRKGEVVKLLPYAGRYYAAINAGAYGTSSILCSTESGWHEIYRVSTVGKMITDAVIQTIPGADNPDRMLISEGTGLVSIPVAINPIMQIGYRYFGHNINIWQKPYIETAWYDFGLKDVNKFFKSVTLFSDCTDTEKPRGTEYNIYVYYKVDNDKDWRLAGRGGAYASQEIDFTNDNSCAGKRIKLRIAMGSNTEDNETPRLRAVVINAVLRVPVKRSWQITFTLEPMKDLQDRQLTDSPSSIYDRLFEWSNSADMPTPLIMNANDIIADNKHVFIDPASISTFQAVSQMADGSGQKEYKHIGSMVLYEI